MDPSPLMWQREVPHLPNLFVLLVRGAQARDLGLVLVPYPLLLLVVQATVLAGAVLQPLRKRLLGPQCGLHLPVQLVLNPHQFGVLSLEAGDDLVGVGDGLLNVVLKLRARDALLQRLSGLVQFLAKSLALVRVRLRGRGCYSKTRCNFSTGEARRRSKRNKEPAAKASPRSPRSSAA